MLYLCHQKKREQKVLTTLRKEMLVMMKLFELLKEFSEGFAERCEVEELLHEDLK